LDSEAPSTQRQKFIQKDMAHLLGDASVIMATLLLLRHAVKNRFKKSVNSEFD